MKVKGKEFAIVAKVRDKYTSEELRYTAAELRKEVADLLKVSALLKILELSVKELDA